MSVKGIMNEIDSIIDDAKTAVLATVDAAGQPQLRWITPGTIPERPGSIFIITAHSFAKVAQAKINPKASIMLQTKILDKVLTLQGELAVLENPSIRSETLEKVGRRLHVFWKVPATKKELVVLEFSIAKAVLYLPQKGIKSDLTFDGEDS